jgi:hypothetical protein
LESSSRMCINRGRAPLQKERKIAKDESKTTVIENNVM